MAKGVVVSVNVGKPQPLPYKKKVVQSGIFKAPQDGPVFLAKINFEGDEQADIVHHGGEDKAVCVYIADHFPVWEKKFNRTFEPGAFGENITLSGLTEADIHIGDVFQMGEAVVQVSQPREPCYKIAARYELDRFPADIIETGYTGFYMRVLKEGFVQKNDRFILLEKGEKQLSILYLNQIRYHDKTNYAAMAEILSVEALAEAWRKPFRKLLYQQ
ncbi:MOSC domain-containing protein [Weizmannia acidilactici]|uniref:MOSC domain-containing protein n=1 Tax=Weizmannia acidilactici TaxID=2607726 RepID=A0A5J4JIH3_9BACI|nr:MOSC domain-containing protein [Weizmannia acidilactici]GER66552.1 MOSC domain-containing protein [Weizmannia acidilactici]GER70227.1 MOSC domain-containing protein [Weizmannia acidilactici]GER74572.1 MOSC domain-containing protein [Weizmannia acidilactici]